MAIACCVLKEQLDQNIEWPLSMNQFYHLKNIEETLKNIGFSNIFIDMSDSIMVDQ